MQRDESVDRRILLAIEAKRSRVPGTIHVDSIAPQDTLDHLAAMYEEGLYSGPKPHKSSSTGEVDLVLVGDLTPAGRRRLKELNEAVTVGPEPRGTFEGVSAMGMAAGETPIIPGAHVGPAGYGGPTQRPTGLNGTTGPIATIGFLDSKPIVQPPSVMPSQDYKAEAVEFSAGGEDRPWVLLKPLWRGLQFLRLQS